MKFLISSESTAPVREPAAGTELSAVYESLDECERNANSLLNKFNI